jgi:hypothetical protein
MVMSKEEIIATIYNIVSRQLLIRNQFTTITVIHESDKGKIELVNCPEDKEAIREYEQIKGELKLKASNEIFDILFCIFIDESRSDEERSIDQEWAGGLLWELKPSCTIDPYEAIKKTLKQYDYSVEELPFYFSEILSMEVFIEILDTIKEEKLTEREVRSLETFQYWAKNKKRFLDRSPK